MKRILRICVLFCIINIPIVFADTTLCGSSGVLKSLKIIYYIIAILKILAPVIIIITGIKSLVVSLLNNDDKYKDKIVLLIQKVMIGAFIFFIPSIIYNIFNGLSLNKVFKEFSTCNECLFKQERCDNLIDTAVTTETKTLEAKKDYIKKLKEKVAAEKAKEAEERKKRNEAAKEKSSGNYLGQKYNLTELELRQIANQCYHEQGSPTGAAAEASLMANRFELFNKKYSSLHEYVKNSGWWAHSSSNMSGSPSVSSSVIEAVRQVLVYGNRTLPLYVDEHDCIKCGKTYDIVSATNNGVEIDRNDRSKYVSGVTVLKNRYGATYTFYSFPTSGSDPFGYTSRAYNKVKG